MVLAHRNETPASPQLIGLSKHLSVLPTTTMGVILSKLFIDVESIPQTGFGMVGKGGGCDVDTTPFPVRRV